MSADAAAASASYAAYITMRVHYRYFDCRRDFERQGCYARSFVVPLSAQPPHLFDAIFRHNIGYLHRFRCIYAHIVISGRVITFSVLFKPTQHDTGILSNLRPLISAEEAGHARSSADAAVRDAPFEELRKEVTR